MNSIRNNTHPAYDAEDTPMHIVEPDDIAVDAYRKATYLGIAAGLRPTVPLAALAWSGKKTSQRTKRLALAIAGGELVADKLPFAPSRLEKAPFIGRLIFGAIAGSLICRRYKQSILRGALQGTLGAALGSFAGYTYRLASANLTGISAFLLASLEDAVAASISVNVTSIIRPSQPA